MGRHQSPPVEVHSICCRVCQESGITSNSKPAGEIGSISKNGVRGRQAAQERRAAIGDCGEVTRLPQQGQHPRGWWLCGTMRAVADRPISARSSGSRTTRRNANVANVLPLFFVSSKCDSATQAGEAFFILLSLPRVESSLMNQYSGWARRRRPEGSEGRRVSAGLRSVGQVAPSSFPQWSADTDKPFAWEDLFELGFAGRPSGPWTAGNRWWSSRTCTTTNDIPSSRDAELRSGIETSTSQPASI